MHTIKLFHPTSRERLGGQQREGALKHFCSGKVTNFRADKETLRFTAVKFLHTGPPAVADALEQHVAGCKAVST
jgi:hypothetical protein